MTSSEPPPGTSAPTDVVAEARAGLARILAATPDTEPNEPLAPCSLVSIDRVDDALARAGVDAPLAEWNQVIGPIEVLEEVRGISCAGSHVGVDDDPSFPELSVGVIVADLGDAAAFGAAPADAEVVPTPAVGGGTVGECRDVDLTDRCVEYWTVDGFVVGLVIADRVYLDRPTASTVLAGLVPAVLDALGGRASDVADPLAAITTEAVRSAAAALVDAPTRGDCPALDRLVLEGLLEASGIDLPADDWRASGFSRPLDGDPPGLQCTGGSDERTVTLTVVDYGDPAAADDFVASVGLADGGSAADLVPGDVTVGQCTTVSGAEYCVEWWRQDGLVVGVQLFAPAADIGPSDAATLLVGVVPVVVTGLAG